VDRKVTAQMNSTLGNGKPIAFSKVKRKVKKNKVVRNIKGQEKR